MTLNWTRAIHEPFYDTLIDILPSSLESLSIGSDVCVRSNIIEPLTLGSLLWRKISQSTIKALTIDWNENVPEGVALPASLGHLSLHTNQAECMVPAPVTPL
jgi:hypothetical protein